MSGSPGSGTCFVSVFPGACRAWWQPGQNATCWHEMKGNWMGGGRPSSCSHWFSSDSRFTTICPYLLDRREAWAGWEGRKDPSGARSEEGEPASWGCSLLGVELCPSKKVCWSPNPQHFRMWSHMERGSLQRWSSQNEVSRMDPNSVRLVSVWKGEIWTQSQTHTEKTMWRDTGRRWPPPSQGMPEVTRS